jgi:REP element-mobilizing transposase RayT/uncharacterized protein YqeY
MNRGRREEDIFSGPVDFAAFVALLKESAEQWHVRVGAYCLLPNHYHLLLKTPLGNLSRFMRHLNGVYTQRYNRAHACDGPLFRGRYKAILVEEDSYLLELVRYIHRNPLKAGIVDKLNQYAWSSHHGYWSAESQSSSWLYKDFILGMLSKDVGQRRDSYRQFVAEEESQELAEIFNRKKLPGILGSERFVDQIRNRFFADKSHLQVPDAEQLAPEVDAIIPAVCAHYGIERGQLMHAVRGVYNEPRNVAMYLIRTLRRDGLLAIGRVFGMRGYSSTSSAVERIKARLETSEELRRKIDIIRRQLVEEKSQAET